MNFMHQSAVLLKEKIVSLSELQRNPSRALDSAIVRIVKSGKEMGIFFQKDQFEDMLEEHLELQPAFKKELARLVTKSKKGRRYSFKDL